MKRIITYLRFLKKVRLLYFFYLNYFCKRVIRKDRSKIIPYKNAIIDISKSACIYLENGDIELGCNLLKGSKEETKLRLYDNAVWKSNGGCKLSYGVTMEILVNATVESKYFTMNSNSVLISAHKVFIGNDVMIGRNVVIYDSDYHTIFDDKNMISNKPQEVIIGDHVWIATNTLVKKGTIIGNNCIIGAYSDAYGIVEDNSMFKTVHTSQKNTYLGTWDRRSPRVDD